MIRACAAAGRKTIKIITGKGNHSMDGPRLLPAVIKYLQLRGHEFEVDQGGGHVYAYLPPPGDEEPGIEDPGPSDRGRQGSSEGSPQRRSMGFSGGGPNGVVFGDFFPGY